MYCNWFPRRGNFIGDKLHQSASLPAPYYTLYVIDLHRSDAIYLSKHESSIKPLLGSFTGHQIRCDKTQTLFFVQIERSLNSTQWNF